MNGPLDYEREQARLSALAHRIERIAVPLTLGGSSVGLVIIAIAQFYRWWGA